jgi:hypothetical protein
LGSGITARKQGNRFVARNEHRLQIILLLLIKGGIVAAINLS